MKSFEFLKLLSFSFVVLSLLFTGCTIKNISDDDIKADTKDISEDLDLNTSAVSRSETEAFPETSVYNDGLNIPVNLYLDTKGNDHYKLCTSHVSDWISKKDIACFAAIISDKPELRGLYKDIWKAERGMYDAGELFRIGYILKFSLEDGREYSITIRSPKDAEADFNTYLEVYLYDDIHQADGQWYSHILEPEITDKTVLTSFKLTAGENIDSVKEISLSVFLYSGEEYFDGTDYIGEHITNIPIIRK